MIIGKELKRLRHERNMSIEHLCTVSGVSVGRIRLIEAGHETTDQRIITALEAALEIELHDTERRRRAGNKRCNNNGNDID